MTRALAGKNGRAKGSSIGDTRQQVIDFYAEVVQNLRAWQARAPKLPVVPDEVPDTPQAEPPPFVAAGEREAGEGRLESDRTTDETFAPASQPQSAESQPHGRWPSSASHKPGVVSQEPRPAAGFDGSAGEAQT